MHCHSDFNFCDVCINSYCIVINDFDQYNKVPKSWPGGPEAFLSTIWASHISSYANLEGHLLIRDASAEKQSLLQATLSSNEAVTFKSLLVDFLKGKGAPDPSIFVDGPNHFDRVVDLDGIDDDGFRSRMFCWAATGSIEQEGPNVINVSYTARHISNADLVIYRCVL